MLLNAYYVSGTVLKDFTHIHSFNSPNNYEVHTRMPS